MDDRRIQAMIFDYGGVLMRTVDRRPRQRLEQRIGLGPGEIYDLVFGSPRWDDVQHGRIDSESFWSDVAAQTGLGAEQVTELRRLFWSGDELDDELVDLIQRLRDCGYRTALLSNAPAGLEAHLRELGVTDVLDVIVVSGEEGVTKPGAEIYERTLERLDVAPEEAVFIDDTPANVEAARRLGIRAARFRGLAPLRVWLRALGVPVPEFMPERVEGIRAVIFDWGGVMEELPDEDDVAGWERRLGLAPGLLSRALWGEAWRCLSVGAISDEEYARHVAEQLGFPDGQSALDFFQAFYASDRFRPGMMRAAESLRERYGVALLSNAFPAQAETIRDRYGVDVHNAFDVYVNSAHVGLSKPDPAIYELALERLGVPPSKAVFLDDTLRNVDMARKLGIHAIQFVDRETSLPQLEALLGHPIGA